MIIPLEKPGTPEELVHFGIKGMKWGVRRSRTSGQASKGMSTKKKVAIGVGVAVVAAGAAYTLYRLSQGSTAHTPLSKIGSSSITRIGKSHVQSQKMMYEQLSTASRSMAGRSSGYNYFQNIPKGPKARITRNFFD